MPGEALLCTWTCSFVVGSWVLLVACSLVNLSLLLE